MEKKYYVSVSGTQQGPFSVEEVKKNIDEQHFRWTDYIYDETFAAWKLLIEHPTFSPYLTAKAGIPSKKSTVEKNSKEKSFVDSLNEKDWYILKEGNNYGPFCQLEVIRMLQEKSLFEYDYIYQESLGVWKSISEVTEFSSENMRKVKELGTEDVSEIFFRRRHMRAKYGASLFLHNNMKVFKGKSVEISAGGAAILVDSAELQPGQSVYLHFKPGDGVPPFNAVCEVVSKQFIRNPGSGVDPVKYGVKFKIINQSIRDSINKFASKAA